MRLFGVVGGTPKQFRAAWLSIPFDLAFLSPNAVTTITDIGLEWTLANNRMDWDLPTNRMDYDLPNNTMDYDLPRKKPA